MPQARICNHKEFLILIGFLLMTACGGANSKTTREHSSKNPNVVLDATNPLNLVKDEYVRTSKLDVLIVIDDSASMSEEQKKVSSNFESLTKKWGLLDWQIAIITTTSCALRNHGKTIKFSDPSAADDFESAVKVGTMGSGTERGILKAFQVLSAARTCDNTWLRSDAALALVFISDEESFCAPNDCPHGSRPLELTNLLTESMQRKIGTLASFAMIWDSADPQCTDDSSESNGTRYVDLAMRMNGSHFSICTPDYRSIFEEISRSVSGIKFP